jgi:putative ABC transport system ATP-binding protein
VSVLTKFGLDRDLYAMGLDIAEQAIELFADLPPDHPFFQQLAFMSPEEIPVYQALVQKLKGKPYEEVSREDRVAIISLSFSYIEPRHRFGLLTDELAAKIVKAREDFYAGLPDDLKDQIERYDPEKYTTTASVMDNVLFGRIGHNQADASEKIRTIVCEILDDLALYDDVLDVGLDFNVGVGGRRLTASQRQKLDVARALLKRADFLILNRPLLALDYRMQEQILCNILEETRRDNRKPAVIWVVGSAAMAKYFDRVIVFDGGQLVEEGTHDTLRTGNGIFKTMLA